MPGWAYKDGRAYMELPAHDLTTSASRPVQQQFYQVGVAASIFTPLSCVLLLHLILDLFLLLVSLASLHPRINPELASFSLACDVCRKLALRFVFFITVHHIYDGYIYDHIYTRPCSKDI